MNRRSGLSPRLPRQMANLQRLRLLSKLSEADPDTKVLDYHDVLLRAYDVELLSGPYWCNDQ